MPRLRTEASKRSFEIGKLLTAEIQAYQTKQANWLAADYTLRFALKPSELPDGRRGLRISTHGSCYYDPRANSISAEFPWSIVSDWRTPGGEGRMARVFPIEDSSILFPPLFDSPWVRPESIELL